MLDRYVAGCAEVVGDDGLCDGRPDNEGYSHIQVSAPKFEPDVAKVEWKSLPANLMYEVLTLPNKIEVANNRINRAFEYLATPPDFSEGFEEREFQYAKLGLEAAELSEKLRKHAKLPPKPIYEWDPVEYMRGQLDKILAYRVELEKHHASQLQERERNIRENT